MKISNKLYSILATLMLLSPQVKAGNDYGLVAEAVDFLIEETGSMHNKINKINDKYKKIESDNNKTIIQMKKNTNIIKMLQNIKPVKNICSCDDIKNQLKTLQSTLSILEKKELNRERIKKEEISNINSADDANIKRLEAQKERLKEYIDNKRQIVTDSVK